jgi:hypothetical protein
MANIKKQIKCAHCKQEISELTLRQSWVQTVYGTSSYGITVVTPEYYRDNVSDYEPDVEEPGVVLLDPADDEPQSQSSAVELVDNCYQDEIEHNGDGDGWVVDEDSNRWECTRCGTSSPTIKAALLYEDDLESLVTSIVGQIRGQ